MRPLTALLALLALGPRAAPAGPRTLERTFENELELVTESFELTADSDGRSVTQDGPRYLREQADEVELLDTLPEGEDPPARFTRLYRTVTSSARIGTEEAPRERTASAGLEGKTVHFERDDDGQWTRSSPDPGTRPVQLKNLRVELALTAFLPPADSEAQAPGESWTIDPATLARLVSPLEEGWRRPRAPPPAAEGALDVAPSALAEPIGALLAAAEGELELTWVERGPDDELPRQASLRFELSSDFDGSARFLGGREGEAEDETRLTYEGTGTLGWDPESGALAIACQGELHVAERFRVKVEAGGKSGEVRGKLAVSGTLTLEAREARGE